MRRTAIGLLLGCELFLSAPLGSGQVTPAASSTERKAPTDLELGGDLAGTPAGTIRYVSRDDLLALHLVSYSVSDDANFTGPTQIKGVPLEELAHAFASPAADLVIAVCDDKYRAYYPRKYIAQHAPLLVLEVNGKAPAGWPKDASEHQFDMGPYMISHPRFVPTFEVLSHSEERQIPWGVVRLEFGSEKRVFGTIAPKGSHAEDAPVQSGYEIARENCFRCHNINQAGEQKSWAPWEVLSAVAAGSPEWFEWYVRDPKTKNPQAQMPANASYDDEILRALTAYFRAFSQPEKPKP